MTETPIKIPKWLSARVYNLNLVPDAGSYDELRHYSAEDIVWLLNQISDEDEIREYATVDCGELNDKQETLIMRGMKLLRDQLENEKRADDNQILTDGLNENIKILDELISLIENEEFFLELTEC